MSARWRGWIRAVSLLVPADRRGDWIEEWAAELSMKGGRRSDAWGALADAWYLRTEGWTMDALWRETTNAVRALSRRPLFAVLAGVTLAVGIGANTAIFSVVDGVLIDPLPFPEPDRVVSYNYDAPGLGVSVPLVPLSEGIYLYNQENARTLGAFAVMNLGASNVTLVLDGQPQRLKATRATHGFFDVLAVPPLLGRAFAEGDDLPGAEPVVVLGYPLWQQNFGGDPSVVGRLIELGSVQRRVVGVMPKGFGLLDEEMWIPLEIDPVDPDIGSMGLVGLARLADGVDITAANTEMEELLGRFAELHADEFPAAMLDQTGLTADVKPLKEVIVEDIRQALWVLLGTVGFVLVIACVNVANLFLVLSETRHREQAVRTALGATRADVLRQHLAEALVLTSGAAVLGVGLAWGGVRILLRLAPADLPLIFRIGIDPSVLAFTAAISLASALVFGLIPVLGYARRGLTEGLKEGGRSATAGRKRQRAMSGLVVAQIALALVLLFGSGLMFRSFVALRSVDPGFDASNMLTFRFGLPAAEYPHVSDAQGFYRRLSERLAAIPGVQAVGLIDGMPLTGAKNAGPMEPEDNPFPEGQLAPIIERRSVTPGFFEAMRVPVVDGRAPEWNDRGDELRGVIISHQLAAQFWPGESPVGRRIRSQGSERAAWEVVGVVGDIRHDAVKDDPMPIVYLPVIDDPEQAVDNASMDVVLHVANPLDAIPAARDALREIDARVPMINPRTGEALVNSSMSSTTFTVLMLGIAAAIALLLGTVGVYGVVSYLASRRTHEIGVRMALGAPAATVLRGVLREGLVLTGIGVAIGLLGAWAASTAVASLLYGVSATDPSTFVGTAALVAAVALLATWLPAVRASRVDPLEALRVE